MKAQIDKILKLRSFFTLKQCSENSFTCILEKPSQMVIQNIYKNWLSLIYAKTHQHFPVYLSKEIADRKDKMINSFYGYFDNCCPNDILEINLEYGNESVSVKSNSELKLIVKIPQQDVMQYFIQWQRYRKFWWSSITTTPGLFSLMDIKYGDKSMCANISGNFKWGQWIVENIEVAPSIIMPENSTLLCCTMSLEKSLLTLLLDATTNSTKEEYLRLHNKMAPYKISFALDCTDHTNLLILQELATQIFHKLLSNKITTWLPNFTLALGPQIKENLRMGVTYTAILSETTLSNGIFHLMNSSTMLKEQVHLADFVDYAALLCGHRS